MKEPLMAKNIVSYNQEISTVDILDSIVRKRAGEVLPAFEIKAIIRDFVAGKIPNYQMSAWLATIASKYMNIDEIESLTRAYVEGGTPVDLSRLNCKIVDKHSTGGVGDKVTLIVAPIVAACGIPVVKISGRGLGHAGGTLDKLESIKGLKLNLSSKEICHIIKDSGMVITGQGSDLVPGDKATYELRDISGAVESIPLIAASIMSKKIATGANCLVLDVKTGTGALIQDYEKSVLLAKTMVALAQRFGINCRAIISDMSQPLGNAVGNALEIKEVLEVLQGKDIPDLREVCTIVARLMLQTADQTLTDDEADVLINQVLKSGKAYDHFLKWAAAQGANTAQLSKPEMFSTSTHRKLIYAKKSGWIKEINPRTIGNAALKVGANRQFEGSVIDHSSGIIVHKKVGDKVEKGDLLAEIHYTNGNINQTEDMVASAFNLDSVPVIPTQIIYQII